MPDRHTPLAVDIDGTLTRADDTIDPRIFDALRAWPGPVVVATGKAFPYPIALCHFIGLDYLVIAENGGVIATHEDVSILGDSSGPEAAVAAMEEAGYEVAWPMPDLVNRWRETEVAIQRTAPIDDLRPIARAHGVDIVDSGYAYHVKDPGRSKGDALEALAAALDLSTDAFIAIGDSENDIELFEVVGHAIAVDNAHPALKAIADRVVDVPYADGTLKALSDLHDGEPVR